MVKLFLCKNIDTKGMNYMINSNRKLVSCVIALIVSIIVSIPLIANALIIYNDPNGDGDIELNDNILITQYLEGSIDVTNLERLDFDNDNIISMADAFEVQLYNLGLLNPGSINLPSAATYNGSSSETYHVFDASTGDLLLYNAYTLYNYNPIPNNLNEPNVTDDIIAITDERVPIWDKSGVVKIMTPNSYIGSGFVIAPHIIATAAHCVFDNSTLDPNDILSESGYIISGIKLFDSNGVNTLTATPVECHVPYSYISAVKNGNYENAFDYALISVEEDLSDYMCFNLGVALDSAVTNEVEISISGFPYEINYVQVNNATNGKPVIIPEEAEVIQLIFKLYIDGGSTHTIAQELNNKKYPTRSKNGKWSAMLIKRILQNEKYIGDR